MTCSVASTPKLLEGVEGGSHLGRSLAEPMSTATFLGVVTPGPQRPAPAMSRRYVMPGQEEAGDGS